MVDGGYWKIDYRLKKKEGYQFWLIIEIVIDIVIPIDIANKLNYLCTRFNLHPAVLNLNKNGVDWFWQQVELESKHVENWDNSRK